MNNTWLLKRCALFSTIVCLDEVIFAIPSLVQGPAGFGMKGLGIVSGVELRGMRCRKRQLLP